MRAGRSYRPGRSRMPARRETIPRSRPFASPGARPNVKSRTLGKAGRWPALVLAVLLLFCWQNTLTQTHLHLETAARLATTAIQAPPASVLGREGTPTDRPENCPLCRLSAQTEHYLTAVPVMLAPYASGPVWRHDQSARDWRVRRWSHAWRSRGPPPLQA